MQKDDVIYRQQAIDAIDRERKKKHLFNTAEDGLLKARGVINTLPSALPCPEGFDPEHLTEQDKKDILEALDWVKGTITEEVPSAQPESCGDVISREYLKEHIEACWINGRPRHAPELNELLSWIDEVPSAEPESETGTWIKIHWKAFRCSKCNRVSEYSTDYCPHCGKKMEGVQM